MSAEGANETLGALVKPRPDGRCTIGSPLNNSVDNLINGNFVGWVINKSANVTLIVNVNVNLEVLPLITGGWITHHGEVDAGPRGQGIGNVVGVGFVHESSIHRIGGHVKG